jgi:hypothetical protein
MPDIYKGGVPLSPSGAASAGSTQCVPCDGVAVNGISRCFKFTFSGLTKNTTDYDWRSTNSLDQSFYVPFVGSGGIHTSTTCDYQKVYLDPARGLVDFSSTLANGGGLSVVEVSFVYDFSALLYYIFLGWQIGSAVLFQYAVIDSLTIADWTDQPIVLSNAITAADPAAAAYGGTLTIERVPCPCRCNCSGASVWRFWDLSITGMTDFAGSSTITVQGPVNSCGGQASGFAKRASDSTGWGIQLWLSIDITASGCQWRLCISMINLISGTVCWKTFFAPFSETDTEPPQFDAFTEQDDLTDEQGGVTCADFGITDSYGVEDVFPCDGTCDDCPKYFRSYITIDGTLYRPCWQKSSGLLSASCTYFASGPGFFGRIYCIKQATVETYRMEFYVFSHLDSVTVFEQTRTSGACPGSAWTYISGTTGTVDLWEETANCRNECPADVATCQDKYIVQFAIGTERRRYCLTKSGTLWQGGDIDNWTITLSCNNGEWKLTIAEVGGSERTVTFTTAVNELCPPDFPDVPWDSDNEDFTLEALTAADECGVPCDDDCSTCGDWSGSSGTRWLMSMTGSDDGRFDTNDVDQPVTVTREPGTSCLFQGGGFKAENTELPYPPLVYTVNVWCEDGFWWAEVIVANDTTSETINTFLYRGVHTSICPDGVSWELFSQDNAEGGSPNITLTKQVVP